jgi:hypothetical protein
MPSNKLRESSLVYRVQIRVKYPASPGWTRWAKAEELRSKLDAYEYMDLMVLVHPESGIRWQVGFEWELMLDDGTLQQYRVLNPHGRLPKFKTSQHSQLLDYYRAWGTPWPMPHLDNVT